MKIAAYTVADEPGAANPRGAQLERLIAHVRKSGDTIVQVFADDADAVRVPLALRRGGGTLLHQLQNRHVDAAIVMRLDMAFPLAGLRILRLPALFHHLGLPLYGIEPPLLVGADVVVDDPASRRWVRDHWDGRAPYGCMFVDGALYRDPWEWATRDRIAALRLEIGLSFGQIRLTLERFGLRAPDGSRQWSTLLLRELVETHERIARVALRDPLAGVPRSERGVREHPEDYIVNDDEPTEPRYAPVALVAQLLGSIAGVRA